MMKKAYSFLFSLLVCLLFVNSAPAQTKSQSEPTPVTPKSSGGGKISTATAAVAPSTSIVITAATSPLDLARAAYVAQGGNKFRDLKSLVLSGSVDLYAPNSVQSLPGKFVIVTAGERSRLEIQSPVFNFRQISDGQQTFVSVQGMELPQPNKYGIFVLMKYDQPGFVVSAHPDDKKLRSFRITDPEGNITDFFVEPATGRVVSYLSPYRGFTFGVDIKSFKEIDGVLVPSAFTQRLETPQGAFFAEHKVKDVKLDQLIADDVFEMPAK